MLWKNDDKFIYIYPCKSELGKVSKQKLAKVLTIARAKSGLTQWKSDLSVVRWFKNLENKSSVKFIEFEIKSFYPRARR